MKGGLSKSKSISGHFSGTRGASLAAGSAYFMDSKDQFSINIKRRKDVDANGFYDVIAHGTPTTIEISHNGTKIQIMAKAFAYYLVVQES